MVRGTARKGNQMEEIPCKKIPFVNGWFASSLEGSMPKMEDKSSSNTGNVPVHRKI
jgi:hypothetical protein